MITAKSFVNKIKRRYPVPLSSNIHFDKNDIQAFEREFGAELPSDFYDFLRVYGYGSFDEYFYIWNPFIDDGMEVFINRNNEVRENYEHIKNNSNIELSKDEISRNEKSNEEVSKDVDCKFSDDKFIVLNGEERFAEFFRAEKINKHKYSKILALGNYYPYKMYPEEKNVIYFGATDDEDFFVHIKNGKVSVVMYDYNYYYEFDMEITEFIYEYLTKKIRLPMINDYTDWTYISYE